MQKVILLVEDSDIDGTVILGRLAKFADLKCHWVHSLAACREMLAVSPVDAILLDLNLDDAAGAELIAAVRQMCGDAPIVVLTNTDDEKTSLMALQSGCEDYLVKVRSDGGVIRRTLLYSIERSRLDRARREAEATSRLNGAIFEHAREGLMITDAQGVVLSVNPAFSTITGFEGCDAVGAMVGFMKSGRHDSGYYRKMWQSLTGEGHWAGEIWNKRRDGTLAPFWLSISAVRNAEGCISNYVAIYTDITDMKRHEEALHHMAYHDALTGLPNRSLLGDRMRQALAKARRRDGMLAVAYIDLDGFKPINDACGHHLGDMLLTEVARRLVNAVREDDTVARLGGDEFVLMLGEVASHEECLQVVERARAAIGRPFALGGPAREISITASIGVAWSQSGDVDADTLLRNADQAMYVAKHEGRNRVHHYDPRIDQQRLIRHETLRSVRTALDLGQFVLFYQPKVHMSQGAVVGAEALIRWLHPEKGLLPPAEFLPLISDPDLSIAIGEWVIRTTLEQLRLWTQVGMALPVSVNIAADHLLDPAFASRLRDILAAFPDVPASMLQIEVVETAALEDVDRAREVLESCRSMGVSSALDDFGTGYSSLTYLRHLPIDTLKIDRSFVWNLTDDAEDLTIVQGVIVLANGFGRKVLAEGIEKAEHGEILLKLGCHLGQGYRIAPPMPANDFLAWRAAWRPESSWVSQ